MHLSARPWSLCAPGEIRGGEALALGSREEHLDAAHAAHHGLGVDRRGRGNGRGGGERVFKGVQGADGKEFI